MGKKSKALFVVIISIVSMIGGTMNGAYAQPADADVFAVVKLSNPGDVIANVGQFVDKIQPGMGAMINSMMVGQLVFKNPTWAGMDIAGVYTVVVLNPMVYPQAPVALIVPMTNKDEFIKAISQSLQSSGETNGIYTFMDPSNQKPAFAAFTGKVGILADEQNVIQKVKALVEGNNPAFKEAPVVKGALTAFVPVSNILTAMRPMIEMFKQQMLMGVEQKIPQAEGTQVQPEAIGNVLQSEVDMVLSLLDQTEKLQLGVDVQPEGVRIGKAVFAKGGSNLAKFMAAQSPQKSSLLGMIPGDSGIIASGSINFTPEFKTGYIEFTKTTISMGPAADAAMVDKVAQWVAGVFEAFTGEFAFGGLSQTADALVTEILTLKDPSQAKQLVGQYPELFKSMAGMYKGMGLDLDMSLTGKEDYKGGEILNFDLGVKAANIPDPKGQEVFNRLFGEGLTLPIGFVKNYSIIGLGKNARGQVQKVMETLDSGVAGAAKYTPAMFGFPEANNLFMYLSIPKIMAWASKNLPDVPAFELQESPGIGISARFVKSHFEGELFVPMEEILTLKGMVEKAQQEKQEAVQPTVQ